MNKSQLPRFSYEFFPPRNENMQRRLWRTVGQLERLDPLFFSMTYGALGSAQQVSIDSAIAMQQESPVALAAHLTCANASPQEIDKVAARYYTAGIRRFVALRGDASAETTASPAYGYVSAAELVQQLNHYDDMDISVAAYPEGHPQASSKQTDLRHLKRKLDAGANRAITQYFFDADIFLRFRDRAARLGIDKPIVPGILPIHDFARVKTFSERCAATVPRHFEAKYAAVEGDPGASYQLSLELAVRLCQRLIDEGVEHLHLYTLNQTDMCLDISLALGASLQSPRLPTAA